MTIFWSIYTCCTSDPWYKDWTRELEQKFRDDVAILSTDNVFTWTCASTHFHKFEIFITTISQLYSPQASNKNQSSYKGSLVRNLVFPSKSHLIRFIFCPNHTSLKFFLFANWPRLLPNELYEIFLPKTHKLGEIRVVRAISLLQKLYVFFTQNV